MIYLRRGEMGKEGVGPIMFFLGFVLSLWANIEIVMIYPADDADTSRIETFTFSSNGTTRGGKIYLPIIIKLESIIYK